MNSVANTRSDDRRRLALAKLILITVLLGMFVIGKQATLWPVINWPMYSTAKRHYPSSSVSRYELIAVATPPGRSQVLTMYDLNFSTGRYNVPERILKCALKDKRAARQDRCRRVIIGMLRGILTHPPDRIEVWKVYWTVDPVAMPPLLRDVPRRRKLLASFEFQDTTRSSQAP